LNKKYEGLPAVVQIFSTCIMVEERSRAFSYLVAFGSVGQTVAAIVINFYFLNKILEHSNHLLLD
jgi:hypothetical protein